MSDSLEDIISEYNCKVREFVFLDTWLTHEDYKSWLEKHENGVNGYCKYCKSELSPKTDSFKKHMKTPKHQLNVPTDPDEMVHEKPISQLERDCTFGKFKIAALHVDRNLPFLLCDYEIPVYKQICHDSKIMSEMEFSRHDVKNYIEFIAQDYRKNFSEELRSKKFSIIADESTDLTACHSLCIIVRYFDVKARKFRENLWDLIEIYTEKESLAKADQLAQKIINSFETEKIPLKNIIGFCSDTCNLMFGVFESVSLKLKLKMKHLKVIRCSAHIQHLAAKKAMEEIPEDIEGFLREVSNYINGSPKKHSRWLLHQVSKKVDPLNVLKPCLTRWLSIGQCITRILSRWTALKTFFEDEMTESNKAEKIYNDMQNSRLFYCLQFLQFVLTKFNVNSSEIQSVGTQLTEKSDKMTAFYKELLSLYMDPDYVKSTNIDLINPKWEKRNIPVNAMKIGNVTRDLMRDKNMTYEEKIDFLRKCKSFLRTACDQLKSKIFETENDATIDRSAFHPKNVLSKEFHQKNPKCLEKIFEDFSSFITLEDGKSIEGEWNRIVANRNKLPEEITDEKDIETFWVKVSEYRDENNTLLCPNLTNFVFLTFLIPNSNASAERLWSKMNLEKTKLRNKLHFSTMRSILLAAQSVKNQGGSVAYTLSEELIESVLRPQQDTKDQSEEPTEGNDEQGNSDADDFDLDVNQCILENAMYHRTKKSKKRGK